MELFLFIKKDSLIIELKTKKYGRIRTKIQESDDY
jgi:hypothetical protein